MNSEEFDPAEVAAAEQLDSVIAAAKRGEAPLGADPVVLWLATSVRTAPPRIRRPAPQPRLWRLFQAAAGVLAVLLTMHALGGVVAGEWIARSIGEGYSRHGNLESGLAFVAVAAVVVAGAMRRRWAPVSVLAGVPLGSVLAVHGVREIGVFAYGAALHIAEGVAALVLLVTWWLMRRYRRAPNAER